MFWQSFLRSGLRKYCTEVMFVPHSKLKINAPHYLLEFLMFRGFVFKHLNLHAHTARPEIAFYKSFKYFLKPRPAAQQ